MEVGLERGRPEVLIEVFESAWDILHEDACLFGQVIVLQISDDVLVVDFGEDGYLSFGLLFIFLAEVYLFDSGENAVVDVERLVDSSRASSADHLADLPLLDALVLADQVVLHDSLLALLQQQRNALHNRHALLSTAAVFQDLGLDLLVRLEKD